VSLAQAREKYIESMRKSAICFFPAIATHFFFLGFETMEEFFWIYSKQQSSTTKTYMRVLPHDTIPFLKFYNRTFQIIIDVSFKPTLLP